MPAKGKVNVNIQTLFCLVLFLDMVAAYRVKKLRKYLLIMILVTAIPIAFTEYFLFPEQEELTTENFSEFALFYYDVNNYHFIFSIMSWIGMTLFAMYLIRYWSNKWNIEFDAEVTRTH